MSLFLNIYCSYFYCFTYIFNSENKNDINICINPSCNEVSLGIESTKSLSFLICFELRKSIINFANFLLCSGVVSFQIIYETDLNLFCATQVAIILLSIPPKNKLFLYYINFIFNLNT